MSVKKLLKYAAKGLGVLMTAIFAVLICVNLYVIAAKAFFKVQYPTVFGYYSAVVVSGSMSGSIEVNDMVIAKRQNEYHIGDIITFKSGNNVVTHRIVGANEDGFITKGDANNTNDMGNPVKETEIIGKVVFVIPAIGSLFWFISSPFGMMCMVFIIILLIEIPVIYDRIKKKRV